MLTVRSETELPEELMPDEPMCEAPEEPLSEMDALSSSALNRWLGGEQSMIEE